MNTSAYIITLIFFNVLSLNMGANLLLYDKLHKHVVSPVNTLHLQISCGAMKAMVNWILAKLTIGH